MQEKDEAFLVKDKRLDQIMGEVSSDEETEPPTTTYTTDIGDSEDEGEEIDTYDPRIEEEDN